MPSINETDGYNLASLYMMRSGAPQSNAALSSVYNAIMSGNVPQEITQEYQQALGASYDESERNRPQALEAFRQSMPGQSAPIYNESRNRNMTSPEPAARPVEAAAAMTIDPASAPIEVSEIEAPATLPPDSLLPLAVPGIVAAREMARPGLEQGRSGRNAPRVPASAGLEGEVLGPEALPDGRNTQVSRRQARTGRDPNFAVTPNDPAASPRAIAAPTAEIGATSAPMLDAATMPIDPMASTNAPRVEMVPSLDAGTDVPAVQVEMPGKGTVFLTADGYIVDANGVELRGVVPPQLESQIMNDPMTSQVYRAFRRAMRAF